MKNLILTFCIAASLLFLGSRIANAAPTAAGSSLTLTVNRTGDGPDLNPGDSLCDASANVGEQCSLRAAIEELNAQASNKRHVNDEDVRNAEHYSISLSLHKSS